MHLLFLIPIPPTRARRIYPFLHHTTRVRDRQTFQVWHWQRLSRFVKRIGVDGCALTPTHSFPRFLYKTAAQILHIRTNKLMPPKPCPPCHVGCQPGKRFTLRHFNPGRVPRGRTATSLPQTTPHGGASARGKRLKKLKHETTESSWVSCQLYRGRVPSPREKRNNTFLENRTRG